VLVTQPLVLIFVKVLEPSKLFKNLAVVMKELAKNQDKDLMFRTKILNAKKRKD
jgi:Na+/H+ antiporter NhaD/arsenite permease-like protein